MNWKLTSLYLFIVMLVVLLITLSSIDFTEKKNANNNSIKCKLT